MKLKEFKEIVNRIHPMYDNTDVTVIIKGKAHNIEVVEWYEEWTENKRVDITVE